MGQRDADGNWFVCPFGVCHAAINPNADVACRWSKECPYHPLQPKDRAALWDKEHNPPAYAAKSLRYR